MTVSPSMYPISMVQTRELLQHSSTDSDVEGARQWQKVKFIIAFNVCLSLPKRSEGVSLQILSVTSFSFHTIEARGLKIGMHILHMDGSKVTNQIFDILPGS